MKDRNLRIDGEYDRPLPKRIENPTKEDQEKLQQLIEKYAKMAEERQKLKVSK